MIDTIKFLLKNIYKCKYAAFGGYFFSKMGNF